MYGFVLLTTTSLVAFTYIVLLMILVMMYADIKLSACVNIYAFLINLVQVVYLVLTTGLTKQQLPSVEIQVIVILLVGIFAITASKITSDINQNQLVNVEKDKTRIEQLLKKIMEVSSSITEGINVIYGQTDKMKQSASFTKNSMQDLSKGAMNTAESVQMQLTQTEEIQKHVYDVETVSNSITADVKSTEEVIELGKDNMDTLIVQVENSQKAGEQVTVQLGDLNQNMEKMQSIIELINQIASQTGLLALNASIEAARAGEAGRGFAVVASEISDLANQTSDATVNITDLINGISGSLQEVVQSVKKLVENNELQSNCAQKTIKSMGDIADRAANISVESQKLVQVVDKLSDANKTIVASIQDISSVTEEVSAHAQETLAGTEENNEIVENISDLMQHLNEKAEELASL